MSQRILTQIEQLHPDVVVLAQGEPPSDPRLLELLRKAPHRVFCDGASRLLLEQPDLNPDFIVGDGDSVPKEIRQHYRTKFIQEEEQDTNDLSKAMRLCKEKSWLNVVILGATGLREDHSLGNIFLLPSYFRQGFHVFMISNYGLFVPLCGDIRLPLPLHTPISFFPLSTAAFSVEGVQYPFQERRFTELWQATLNLVTAPEVHLSCKEPILVYIAHEPRSSVLAKNTTSPC